ncbi:flippase-like domain-containing protein [Patescibacteria group bacterium]|nr:flippase-like domain-containing protein [Patescibacteria group bacterium]
MINKKNIISKIISFFIVALIFYFLGRNLFLNWEQIKEHQFSLSYFYLAFSFICLGAGFISRGLVWKKIVNFLQADNDLGYLEAIRIVAYSQLGKYLPGKVFSVVGMIYLSRNKNISKKNLYLSVIFAIIFSIIASFVLSLFLIGFFFVYSIDFFIFYLIGILVILGGLIVIHPRVFQYLVRLFFNKIKKEPIDLDFDLSWLNRIKIILYYAFADFWTGFGFFCLINSITYLSIQNLFSIIGVYVLAMVLGLVVFFAPSGLGVREGVLVLFLQFYFSLNVAILISLLARVWAILGDLFLAGGFYLSNIFKKIKYN